MDKSTYVVYQMTYTPTGQYYVGSTCEPLKRWRRHRYEMRKGRHHNRGVTAILVAGYVAVDWEFSVLSEHPDEVSGRVAEEVCLAKGRRDRLCLNIGRHATGGDNLSRHPDRSDIIMRRQAAQVAAIAKMTVEEKADRWGRCGKDNPMFGRARPDSVKAAISAANKGHSRNKGIRRSEATKARLSELASKRTGARNHFFGKSHTEATKAKLSEANKGRKPLNQRPVRCDGTSYEGVTDAARAIGVSPPLVIYRIKSKKWDYHYL
jgi:group I intron endonuclease